jgi:hypothetical protein
MSSLQEKRLQFAEDLTSVIEFNSDAGETHSFVIENNGDIPIEMVWLSCGSCTAIKSLDAKKIRGTFTPPSVWNLTEQEKDLARTNGFVIKDYIKNITVYADDGESPHKVFDHVYKGNPEKLAMGVQLKAKVKVTL